MVASNTSTSAWDYFIWQSSPIEVEDQYKQHRNLTIISLLSSCGAIHCNTGWEQKLQIYKKLGLKIGEVQMRGSHFSEWGRNVSPGAGQCWVVMWIVGVGMNSRSRKQWISKRGARSRLWWGVEFEAEFGKSSERNMPQGSRRSPTMASNVAGAWGRLLNNQSPSGLHALIQRGRITWIRVYIGQYIIICK
jgi:hypothetical protein